MKIALVKLINDLSNSSNHLALVNTDIKYYNNKIWMDELESHKKVILNVKKIVIDSLITLSKCKFIDNYTDYKITVDQISSELTNIENILNELIDLVMKKPIL